MKMKQYIKLFPMLALTAVMAASCADDEILPFDVAKPESIAQYEYLKNYDVLKSYVDRQAHPGFRLGGAIGANDFINKGVVYELIRTNFDEMTPGNEMKYASVVNDEGVMNFTTVKNFIEAAKEAGVTIYGHTLGWHAQQNMNYLNGLIADQVILPDPEDINHYFLLHQDAKANPWDGQVYYTLSTPLTNDTEYTLSFRAKASNTFNFQFWTMNAASTDVTVNGGTLITADWTDYSYTFVPNGDVNTIKLVVGELEGDFCIDDLSLTAVGSDENLIINGDFESEDMGSWQKYSWHSVTYSRVEETSGGGGNGGYCLVLTNNTMQSANYGAQAWYQFSTPLKSGVSYTFTCMAKASTDYANLAPFLQSSTTSDQAFPAGFPVGTDWAEKSISFTPDKDVYDKFTFNFGDFVGTIYIDDVKIVEAGSSTNLVANGDFEAAHIDGWASWSGYQSLSADGEGYSSGSNVIEMTPEEKKDTLTWALDNWITGMMEACGGYVTAWDAANETVSGVDRDGDGIYDLQDASNGDPSTNFYWTDYLGDLDYVRTIIRLARERFAEFGGNPSDLKLFINDFNLESWWDGNKKATSLVEWIKRWEADGVTKIDGIGTQMHVSLKLNESDQKAQEESIVKMFQILAASGKLVKISELDMGVTEAASGDALKTEDITYDIQLKMADFYKFIIDKYFEIIPQAQQYGITQWCMTDSPADSGWRGGEPVGLWDLNYNRKPTYAGFANGLAGREIVPPYAASDEVMAE